MKIVWTNSAWDDADRLHAFAARYNLDRADEIFVRLAAAPSNLPDFPRRGPRLSEFGAREVRELRVGLYVIRYELTNDEIRVLRIFHARENRF